MELTNRSLSATILTTDDQHHDVARYFYDDELVSMHELLKGFAYVSMGATATKEATHTLIHDAAEIHVGALTTQFLHASKCAVRDRVSPYMRDNIIQHGVGEAMKLSIMHFLQHAMVKVHPCLQDSINAAFIVYQALNRLPLHYNNALRKPSRDGRIVQLVLLANNEGGVPLFDTTWVQCVSLNVWSHIEVGVTHSTLTFKDKRPLSVPQRPRITSLENMDDFAIHLMNHDSRLRSILAECMASYVDMEGNKLSDIYNPEIPQRTPLAVTKLSEMAIPLSKQTHKLEMIIRQAIIRISTSKHKLTKSSEKKAALI